MKPKNNPATDDQAAIALLTRHHCPTPFHEVRAWFFGSIASPVMHVAPLQIVQSLWGGELPAMASERDANELLMVLINGLWNRLTTHQDPEHPFELWPTEVPVTRQGLRQLAQVRTQEIDGFIKGLFGPAEQLDLPQEANQAVTALADARSILGGVVDLLDDPSKPAEPEQLEALLVNLKQIAHIAGTEINRASLACVRLRGGSPQPDPSPAKPTLH